MDFANPFALPGYWFKGCLHVHSTASDGCLTPEEVIDWYRSRGYHFLALTDHGVLSEAQSLGDGFITLSGIEFQEQILRSHYQRLIRHIGRSIVQDTTK